MGTAIRFVAFVLVATTGSALAGDLEPPGSPAPTMNTLAEIYSSSQGACGGNYQFIGTTTPAPGDSGIFGMTRKCQQEFGTTAKMCTSADILRTLSPPGAAAWNSSRAWLQPTFVAAGYDISGLSGDGVFWSCEGWSSTSGQRGGFSISFPAPGQEGWLGIGTPCFSADVGVACCAPTSP